MSSKDNKVLADFLASKAGQLRAVVTLMATQAADLGCGTPAAREDLTDLLYAVESMAITVSKHANDLANSLAKQNPGS